MMVSHLYTFNLTVLTAVIPLYSIQAVYDTSSLTLLEDPRHDRLVAWVAPLPRRRAQACTV